MPECFAPFSDSTKYFQCRQEGAAYRIALANGFVGNTWRIQMIKTAKAYAEEPDVAPRIEEFKVVSTGTDVAAQVAAIDNFINAGYDAILDHRGQPDGCDAGDQARQRAGVVLVPFDNVLDSERGHPGQRGPDRDGQDHRADWLTKNVGATGKIIEVRGLPGNSVDRDRHVGFREIMEGDGQQLRDHRGGRQLGRRHCPEGGRRCDRRARPVRRHVRAGRLDRRRARADRRRPPFIPVAGEAENGYRKLCAEHAEDGLVCSSAGQSPGLVAIAAKTAIHALQGDVATAVRSRCRTRVVEHPDFEAGVNYYPRPDRQLLHAERFSAVRA